MSESEIIIDIESLNILGVDGDIAFLYENMFDEDDNEVPCVIMIHRGKLEAMLKAWLDEKADYLKRYNHFCGVGYIYLENPEELPESERIVMTRYIPHDDQEDREQEEPVRTFIAGEWAVDMEHG